MIDAKEGVLARLRRVVPVVLGLTLFGAACAESQTADQVPPGEVRGDQAVAIFAGGCFWCVEEAFDKVDGVLSTTSGYIGGEIANPTYKQVSAGGTGHAEAVRVVYDPDKVSYGKLVQTFWLNVDPVTPNAQFCDRGSQYRSAVFYGDETQRQLAEAFEEADRGVRPIRPSDRDGDRACQHLLPGRGLSSGLLHQESGAL